MNSEYEKNNEEKIVSQDNAKAVCNTPAELGAPAPVEKTQEAPTKKLPLICKIIYCIAGLSALLYILFLIFPKFADFFNRYVSPFIRGTLSYLTGWIPFSLAECILLLVPVIIIAVVSLGIKYYGSSWKNVGVFCLIILSVGAYVFSTFTLGFFPAYKGSRLDAKMGLEKSKITSGDLLYTSLVLANNLKFIADDIVMDEKGASVMPYGYDELNDKLMDAYQKVCSKYDFIQKLDSRYKRIMLSEPMTYTHISGVYTFFTGEANINTNFPDYTLPFTAAHEFAHQRGIAREDEANFVAFLVCMEADDPYIQYSGYLNLYEHVGLALIASEPELYTTAYQALPQKARSEMMAYSRFFEKYADNIASDVSGVINDLSLKANGTEGTVSYSMVVELAVAYYKQK